ncbi:hypothetical protein DNTS_010145 [Danionella cerebrum]|uniref:FA complementation group C n=1 Tax=Danionella cerebrum TaxID=2873325 RepID=A0A553Q9C5_9TELE|nr:hypothetical protein DNTS_010145 [Danionella translucida]
MAMVSQTDVQFWMEKAVSWGEATSPSALLDTSKHLGSLRKFLQQLLEALQQMSSTSEAMKTFPFVGQFLGRLCWNPCVTADERSQSLLLRCLSCLNSAEPQNAVERKANTWIKNILCHLISEEEGGVAHATVKHAGSTPKQYHTEALQKVVSLMTEEVFKSCHGSPNTSSGCSNLNIETMSTACIALVTCPQMTPLIAALLKHSVSCGCSSLNQEFLKEVHEAFICKRLFLEDEVVVALWCQSPSCLEEAVVRLLDSVLSDHQTARQNLDKHVSDSLLPQASARHCHIFLAVSEIYRNVLVEIEENLALRTLIQVFTACFLQSRTRQRAQSLFPQCHNEFNLSLADRTFRITKESLAGSSKLDHKFFPEAYQSVFEAWMLLVQCGFWVDTAAEMLVLAAPQKLEPLLWLLVFFHHPTNRGHQNSQQVAVAREACTHLRTLFLTQPPPPRLLHAIKELLSSTLSSNLVLHLFANFAVFSHGPVGSITAISDVVLPEPLLKCSALWVLASIRCRLNRASSQDSLENLRERRRQALQLSCLRGLPKNVPQLLIPSTAARSVHGPPKF